MRGEGKSYCIGSGKIKIAPVFTVHAVAALLMCTTGKPVVFATDHDVRTKQGVDRNDTAR